MSKSDFDTRVAADVSAAGKQLAEEVAKLHQKSGTNLYSATTMVRSEQLTAPILHKLVLRILDEYEAVKADDFNRAFAINARSQLEGFCSSIWTGWNTNRLMLDSDAVSQGRHRIDRLTEAALSLFDRSIPPPPIIAPVDDEAVPDARLPASDRYVAISDNARADISAEIASLQDTVKSANDVSDEDRLIAISELAAFESTILQSRVSTALIERFVKYVLAWIQNIIPKALVTVAVEKLITTLLPFLS